MRLSYCTYLPSNHICLHLWIRHPTCKSTLSIIFQKTTSSVTIMWCEPVNFDSDVSTTRTTVMRDTNSFGDVPPKYMKNDFRMCLESGLWIMYKEIYASLSGCIDRLELCMETIPDLFMLQINIWYGFWLAWYVFQVMQFCSRICATTQMMC